MAGPVSAGDTVPDVDDRRNGTPARRPRDGGRAPLFRHPGRVAIVAGGLFLVAALTVGAIQSADTSDLQTQQRVPAAVEGFSPAQGAKVPPNIAISVDLKDDLIGEFTVCAPTPSDCTPIPLDQTQVVEGLGQVTFKPRDGSDVTEWPAGPVTVKVDYHLQGSLAADAGSFAWSFFVTA
jgi:hypothetical protein